MADSECDGASEGTSKVAERDDESDANSPLVIAVPDRDEVDNSFDT